MKIKLSAVLTLVLSFSLFHTQAQKIKYKDIYPLLAAKNYEEGGPKLIQFLSDEKNAEEANANLQMGLWLENRFLNYDVVDDSTRVYDVGDSAIFYLEKAKSLITEKELKKKDQYYQAFFRRDLRTGEFGIKVSDVHLDIEKKVEGIEKRIADTKKLHNLLSQISDFQKEAVNVYRQIVSRFSTYNEMLLGADEDTQTQLSSIETNAKMAVENARKAKEVAVKLKSRKYTDDLKLKSIANYGLDGMEPIDISGGELELWDFETWAREAKSEIRGGVALFKIMIKNYADEIRAKKEQVKNSQDVEIGEFPAELEEQFATYDPESTVEKLLKVERYEAKISKQVDLQLNPALMDSSLIGPQLEIFSSALEDAKKMNVLIESITTDDLEIAKKMYTDYIESFFQKYVTASKYVQEMQAWSRRHVEWLGDAVEYWTEKNRWGMDAENEEMMYPLFVQDTPEAGFMTMGVPVSTPEEVVVYGVDLNSKKGYVASFGPDRIAKWKLEFELPGTESIQYESDSIPTIAGSESFYIYNTAATENNFVVVSYTPSGQLNWGTVVTITRRPVDFQFDDLTQELTILLYPEDQLPLDSDELGYVVIDRTGNAR